MQDIPSCTELVHELVHTDVSAWKTTVIKSLISHHRAMIYTVKLTPLSVCGDTRDTLVCVSAFHPTTFLRELESGKVGDFVL